MGVLGIWIQGVMVAHQTRYHLNCFLSPPIPFIYSMWASALQLFLLFPDVVNSSSNWLLHPFDISPLLGSKLQTPKIPLPLTMSQNVSLGSAQAGPLIGSTERLLVTPSTSQRPQKPGRTIVSYLSLQVNGASSSLLAQACNTYQSPMLTSRLLRSFWTGTYTTHQSPQALLTLKPPPPPLPPKLPVLAVPVYWVPSHPSQFPL